MIRVTLTLLLAVLMTGGCGKKEPSTPAATEPAAPSGGEANKPVANSQPKESPLVERRYTMFWRASKETPPGGVGVKLKVPADWAVEVDDTGAPGFRPPKLEGSVLAELRVVVIHCGSTELEACNKRAVGLQFNEQSLARSKRADRGNGRHWVFEPNEKNPSTHMRLFVPVPAKRSMVMCVATLANDSNLRAAYEAACDSIVVEGDDP